MFPQMINLVPEGNIGAAKIEHREVPQFDAMMSKLRGEPLNPGKFCYLSVGGTLYMSDTENERRTNRDFVRHAHGHVLVAGLGIGMILHPILARPSVQSVTVIERSQDVIDLVSPTIKSSLLEIQCADIYTWSPSKGRKFNVIYFDIWPSQSTDDLMDMAKLHQRGKVWLDRTDDARWMNSWNRDSLLARRKRELRGGW